ncbi:16S rRNA (guanine(966)-N(2))-methyltransferase RsmD [Granulosicoccus sp.]|nr:16S rRNA (guanine(966)-N(2))-methyltransferase RsmD [Granulosicoccus sp.]MDB4222454.1 16S rRNA (guanine(966)-N(2))-methyltransferase RsmD [Granulosicoccus sp.]
MSPSSNRSSNQRPRKSFGQVRIIAGKWRGRKLPVPVVTGLRPTGDRVRETLFNWLQPHIADSHCLDLFAGTGAIGLEALSRYAASVTFVEPNGLAFSQLESSLRLLDDNAGTCRQTTAERFLSDSDQPFDIVFVDPPFEIEAQMPILQALNKGHLSSSALVYMEAPRRQAFTEGWPTGYELCREKQFGDVSARLFKISGKTS